MSQSHEYTICSPLLTSSCDKIRMKILVLALLLIYWVFLFILGSVCYTRVFTIFVPFFLSLKLVLRYASFVHSYMSHHSHLPTACTLSSVACNIFGKVYLMNWFRNTYPRDCLSVNLHDMSLQRFITSLLWMMNHKCFPVINF